MTITDICRNVGIALFLSSLTLAQDGIVTIGMSPHPISAELDASGEWNGFFPDVFREAAKRENLRPVLRVKSERMEDAIASGEVDVYAGAFFSPERRSKMHFTRPWWQEPYYLLAKAESGIGGISDLRGKSLLYEKRPPISVPVELLAPEARRIEVGNRRERISSICAGAGDVALINHISLVAMLEKPPVICRGVSLRLLQPAEIQMQLSVTSPFANRDLAEKLRDRIDEMYADGTMAAIFRKYPLAPLQADALETTKDSGHSQSLWGWTFAGLSLLLSSAIAYLAMARRRTKQALDAAEAGGKSKEEFMAILSHEIRTPLNAVMGFLDLLQETPLRPEQRQLSEEVGKAAAAMLALTGDLMEFSKLRSGEIVIRRRPVDVAALTDQVTATHRLAAVSKNLELVIEVRPEVPEMLLLDSERLRQILMNLVGNAVKFTDSGYVKVWVGFENEKLRFSVSDTGPGIEPSQIRRIFDPFQQIDTTDARPFSGVGLGLAIASRLAQLMDGELGVESQPGFGSHFQLVIPASPAEGSKPWIELLAAFRGERIVFVARKTAGLAVLREYLTFAGVDAAFFPTDRDARMQMPAGNAPRWVFTDPTAIEDMDAWLTWLRTQYASATVAMVLIGEVSEIRMLPAAIRDRFEAIASYPVAPNILLKLLIAAEPLNHRSLAPVHESCAGAQLPILVVDDNPVNRKVATALLTKLGCKVDVAEDGRAAVARAAENEYSMVLMDCQMPVMDGFEATQQIRNGRTGAEVQIIGVSASTEADTQRKCLAAGMNSYLPKPLTLAGLSKLLSEQR